MTICADDLRTIWSLALEREPEDAEGLAALLGSREEALAALVLTEKAFDAARESRKALDEGARLATRPTPRRREPVPMTPNANQAISWRVWKLVTGSRHQCELADHLAEAAQRFNIDHMPDDWRFLPEQH